MVAPGEVYRGRLAAWREVRPDRGCAARSEAIAGVGNVYRVELLFPVDIDPATPAKDLDAGQVERLRTATEEPLRAGERSGGIITVDPGEVGARSTGDLRGNERLYAYKRDGQPCRRCGSEIPIGELGGRSI